MTKTKNLNGGLCVCCSLVRPNFRRLLDNGGVLELLKKLKISFPIRHKDKIIMANGSFKPHPETDTTSSWAGKLARQFYPGIFCSAL